MRAVRSCARGIARSAHLVARRLSRGCQPKTVVGGKDWPRPCLGPATGGHYRHRCRSFSNFINRRPIAGAIARRIDEKQQRLRAKRIPTGESHPRIRCKYLNELVLFFCCLQLTLSLSRGWAGERTLWNVLPCVCRSCGSRKKRTTKKTKNGSQR